VNETRDDILDHWPGDLWHGEPPSAFVTRITHALYRDGIFSVRDLTECSPQDLLRIRQFGPAMLDEVRRVLARHGLSLAGESM
jgi:DNA-directed RNA polymerase alpha subunit